MRKTKKLILSTFFVIATPAFAGNLTLDNGQTTWHSTQCTKPMAPGSVMGAKSDTDGDNMNSLISQHNAYVDAMQAYMNCLSDEAAQDQSLVDKTIIAGAEKNIQDAQMEVDNSAPSRRKK